MTYDVIIVGGGISGLTLACALAKQTSLSIAVLEAKAASPAWSESDYHHRVSAITLSSQRAFQALEVWDGIKQRRISSFRRIQVWDHRGSSQIEFSSSDIAQSNLGFIVENNVIQLALEATLKKYPQVTLIPSVTLTALQESPSGVELIAADTEAYKAKLIVAADGFHSWVRQAIGIPSAVHAYHQDAIVSMVRTHLPHQHTARQRFLATGPLALLPLAQPHLSSIVWSLPDDEAKQLMELDEEDFREKLNHAFAAYAGEVESIGPRYCFPLQRHQSAYYVKSRVVLIGDAAHTVHPLAGQGINMGILDAISLAEVIVDAIHHGRDIANMATLRRYERWRKADNAIMMTGIDMIKDIFASDNQFIHAWRSVGLSFLNKTLWIKNLFIRHAVGDRKGLPKLAQ